MELRKGVKEDDVAIRGLLGELGYPGTETFVGRRLERMLADPDEEIAVCVHGGAVVGVISFHFIPQLALPGDFARISYLCVARGEQGRGAGRLLVEYCAERALRRGCDRIELHCHERRVGAHGFYRHLGFVEAPKYFTKSVGR